MRAPIVTKMDECQLGKNEQNPWTLFFVLDKWEHPTIL